MSLNFHFKQWFNIWNSLVIRESRFSNSFLFMWFSFKKGGLRSFTNLCGWFSCEDGSNKKHPSQLYMSLATFTCILASLGTSKCNFKRRGWKCNCLLNFLLLRILFLYWMTFFQSIWNLRKLSTEQWQSNPILSL